MSSCLPEREATFTKNKTIKSKYYFLLYIACFISKNFVLFSKFGLSKYWTVSAWCWFCNYLEHIEFMIKKQYCISVILFLVFGLPNTTSAVSCKELNSLAKIKSFVTQISLSSSCCSVYIYIYIYITLLAIKVLL